MGLSAGESACAARATSSRLDVCAWRSCPRSSAVAVTPAPVTQNSATLRKYCHCSQSWHPYARQPARLCRAGRGRWRNRPGRRGLPRIPYRGRAASVSGQGAVAGCWLSTVPVAASASVGAGWQSIARSRALRRMRGIMACCAGAIKAWRCRDRPCGVCYRPSCPGRPGLTHDR